MDNSDIGFIGAVLGIAFGIIGALFGAYVSTKNYIKGVLECPNIKISDKLDRISGYMKTMFCSFVVMVVFIVLSGFLVKYVNSESHSLLYVGLLMTLAFSFQTLYLAIWRKHIKYSQLY